MTDDNFEQNLYIGYVNNRTGRITIVYGPFQTYEECKRQLPNQIGLYKIFDLVEYNETE